MKIMTQREQLTYMKKFLDYLEIYGDNYPDEAIGLLEPEKNCYLGFAKMIGETYGWNSHILEVGGGFYSAFSKYMDQFQQSHNGSGTITTFDPRLIVNKLGNVKLHREEFREEMTTESYDLIVGIMPCEATSMIIRKATKEHKEFFLAMCGCIHYAGLDVPREMFGPIPITYDEYVEKIYDLAKKQEQDGFKVIKEDAKQYSFKYPIIRSQRRR